MNWKFWKQTPSHALAEATPKPYRGKAYVGSVGEKELYQGEINYRQQFEENLHIYQTRSEVSSSLITLAGYVVSRGYTTQASDPKDPVAEEAKELCDKFAGDIGLDLLIYEGTIKLALNGVLFLEKNLVSGSLVAARIFPWQEDIEPAQFRSDGEVLAWRQVSQGSIRTRFKEDELVVLRLPPVDRNGYGTSLIQSLLQNLSIRDQINSDVKDYLHKVAHPKELWVLGTPDKPVDETTRDDAFSLIKTWVPGQNFVADYPVQYTPCGVGSVESRLFPLLLERLDARCADGLMVPSLGYLRNATEASANAMIANLRIALIQPIQRIWKRKIENELFSALLEGEGISEEYVPQITFTPPSEEEIVQKVMRVKAMFDSGLITLNEGRAMLDLAGTESPPLEQKPESPEPVKGDEENPDMTKKPLHQTREAVDAKQLTWQATHRNEISLDAQLKEIQRKAEEAVHSGEDKEATITKAKNEVRANIKSSLDRTVEIARSHATRRLGKKPSQIPDERIRALDRRVNEYVKDFEKILRDSLAAK